MTTTHPTVNTADPAAPEAFAGARRAPHYIETIDTPPPVIDTVPPELSHPTQAEPTPASAPEDLHADLGELAITAPPRIAKTGLRGLAGRVGITLAPGAKEVAEIARAERVRRDEETIRQATWTRAVSILIANPKGGVGKTPTALLLGGILAAVRGGSVCIVEVSDDPGALTFRSEGRPTRGLGELVRDAADIRSAGQLAGYTAPQSSFAAVIGSIGARPRLDGDDVTTVAHLIDDYFAIRVMDSGNQPSSAAFNAAAYTADVLVIPIFSAGDAALEAAALLDSLKTSGTAAQRLAATAIIIRLHDGRPENPQVSARVEQILESYTLPHVHDIPYDPHIAERGQISLGSIATPTRDALRAAAADVVRTLHTTIR